MRFFLIVLTVVIFVGLGLLYAVVHYGQHGFAVERVGHQRAGEHVSRIQKNIGMLLLDDGRNHCQTAGSIFWEHVTMNIVRMHEHDMSLRRACQGKCRKQQCREDQR